jgi:hypothetical protein
MEFLSLEESLYSDGKKGKSNKDNVNIILSVVGQGLEVKEQTDLNNFVGGLTEAHKTYFSKVIKSKSTDQEKAIISALLNKYPKLKNNEAQQREFREHLENMLDTGKVKSGALKYLLERLLEVDKKKKEEEQAEAEAEAEEQQAPEGEAPEGGEEAPEGAAQPQAADTESSEEDRYSLAKKLSPVYLASKASNALLKRRLKKLKGKNNKTPNDLKEIEELNSRISTTHKAIKYHEDKFGDLDLEYIEEDKEYSMKFNKEEVLARREAYGSLLGAIIGASTELYKLKNLPGKSRINKEFKSLHKSLSTENMNNEQKEALHKLVGILKSNKPISTAESYYYKITSLFSRKQSRDLRYLIRLGADSRGVKVPSFSKTLIKSGSGAISGYGLASMSRGSNTQYSDMDLYYDDPELIELMRLEREEGYPEVKSKKVNLQRNTKALPGIIYKEQVKRNNYSGTFIEIPLKKFKSQVGQDDGFISPTITLTFKSLDLSKVRSLNLKPLQLENQSSVYVGGRHNNIGIEKLILRSTSNGFTVEGTISVWFNNELDDVQDEDFRFKTSLKVAKDRNYSGKESDMDFYSEWEKEFNNKECELTEDDFNDKIDYDEVEEYLQFPSRERMSSEYLKNNPMNKAEKFLESKRKEKSPEDSGYSSLMVAEDFILSRKIAKDSTYGYVKSGIVGGLAGTAIGAGIGHVSTLKDKRLAKENAQKYAANKGDYMKAKAKAKKLLNKSGFNYNDQKEAKELKKELSKLKRSHIYTPEQEKELAELRSKLQAVESMESTARSINGLANNSPLGQLAANAAIAAGSTSATSGARARMAQIKSKGKLAAQAKYEEKLKELKKLNSKKNFTDEDKEKYDRLRKFIKDHKNTGRRAAFHDAKRRGAMRAGITSGMAIGTAAGLGRELYKRDFKD